MKYRDASLPLDQRLNDLMARLTLPEKVGQLNQHMFGWRAYRRQGENVELTEEFKQHVERFGGMGALYGLFRADPWSAVTFDNGLGAPLSARAANAVQRHVIQTTRLGIPVLLAEECPHGHMALQSTQLPTGIGVAATWNPPLYQQAMERVAAEIRGRGAHLGLITLDLARDPRWGRTEECLGEDPYLAARLGAAAVYGLQGRAPGDLARADRVAATCKHFAAHGVCEGGRNLGPAAIGERELREIHLPATHSAVQAGAQSLMACYNELDGIPCHANRKLLTDILRGEWGFAGFVMADGTAIDRLLMQTGSHPAAAAMALSAGVDLSLWDEAFLTLEQAVRQGLVSEELIDQAVRRVLRVKFLLGLFENPYVAEEEASRVVGGAAVCQASLELARESITLLKNEGALLPLSPTLKRIAVIGPNADNLYNQLGDYTAPQRAGTGITVLEGLRRVLGEQRQVGYARGCGIRDMSRAGIAEAVELARSSEAVVLVLGGSSARNFETQFYAIGSAIVIDKPTASKKPAEMDSGEGTDLASLELGGVQMELLQAILATGIPTVAVLIQGRPHTIGWLVQHCPAIVCAWYPGPFGGQAVAEALFGKIDPSGRLPLTLPKSSAQLPVCYNRKDTGRELAYRDIAGVEYPFGFGLSYTQFAYRELNIAPDGITAKQIEAGAKLQVQLTVENTGQRAGAEVVQVYVKDHEASITRRILELKGFEKVHLQPGESRAVTFTLGQDELAIWNPQMAFVVEPGTVSVMVGSSSQDIRLRQTMVIG